MNTGSQVLLLVTLAGAAAAVHLIAAHRPGRLMLVRLPHADRHRSRSRRATLVNGVVAIAAAIAIGFAPEARMQLGAWFAALLVPPLWMLVELRGALRGVELPRVSSRFHVWLEEPPRFTTYLSPPLQLLGVVALIAPAVVLSASSIALWPWVALFAPLILFLTALVMATIWQQSRERWALPERDKERYVELQVERRRRIARSLETAMVCWNAAGGLIWVSVAAGPAGPAYGGAAVAMIIALIGALLPLVAHIPALARIADELAEIAGTEALGTRDDGWRLRGLVYCSTDDPALFVPKRSGLGQTINVGRPAAWLLISGVLLAPPAITALALVAVGA